jgi:hypothetical protein
MNIDDGKIRFVPEGEPLGPREVEVPQAKLEELINATRQQRRAWARAQAKLLIAEGRGDYLRERP